MEQIKIMCHLIGYNIVSIIYQPKMHDLNPVMRKHPTNLQCGTFYKIVICDLQTDQGNENQKKGEELF